MISVDTQEEVARYPPTPEPTLYPTHYPTGAPTAVAVDNSFGAKMATVNKPMIGGIVALLSLLVVFVFWVTREAPGAATGAGAKSIPLPTESEHSMNNSSAPLNKFPLSSI